MKVGQATDICYNVQISVDSKHKLIVDHEVINDVTDQGQLSNMAVRAKEILEVDQLEVVADSRYFDGRVEIKRVFTQSDVRLERAIHPLL